MLVLGCFSPPGPQGGSPPPLPPQTGPHPSVRHGPQGPLDPCFFLKGQEESLGVSKVTAQEPKFAQPPPGAPLQQLLQSRRGNAGHSQEVAPGNRLGRPNPALSRVLRSPSLPAGGVPSAPTPAPAGPKVLVLS